MRNRRTAQEFRDFPRFSIDCAAERAPPLLPRRMRRILGRLLDFRLWCIAGRGPPLLSGETRRMSRALLDFQQTVGGGEALLDSGQMYRMLITALGLRRSASEVENFRGFQRNASELADSPTSLPRCLERCESFLISGEMSRRSRIPLALRRLV